MSAHEVFCAATDDEFMCTRPAGHDGPHEAHGCEAFDDLSDPRHDHCDGTVALPYCWDNS